MKITKGILFHIIIDFAFVSFLVFNMRVKKVEEVKEKVVMKNENENENEEKEQDVWTDRTFGAPEYLWNKEGAEGGKGPFDYEKWYVDPSLPREKKKTINVKFVDFWEPEPTNERPNCYLCNYLSKVYNLNFTDEPDFLFYSVFGMKNREYTKCIRIFFSGENLVPDFNYCDYAISFNRMDFYGRNFKYSPLIGLRGLYGPFNASRAVGRNMTQRKFCNFVYSDSNQDREGVRLRERFFQLLSKYKRIDSPGHVFNNMKDSYKDASGNWHDGKFEFLKGYKFTIAFENSNSLDYTTEKLPDALFAHSVPIYFGNPSVGLEYNKKAFIYVNDYKSLEDVVAKVIELDKDDDAYMAMLTEPIFLHPEYDYEEEMTKFFTRVIETGRVFPKDPAGYATSILPCEKQRQQQQEQQKMMKNKKNKKKPGAKK